MCVNVVYSQVGVFEIDEMKMIGSADCQCHTGMTNMLLLVDHINSDHRSTTSDATVYRS